MFVISILLKVHRHAIIRSHTIWRKIHTTTTHLSTDGNDFVAPDQLDLIDSHKFCVAHVKRYDRENYLAALCISDPLLRRAVFCLRAFNVELSLVRDSTTNSDRAKIRFHFWSKLIEEIIRRNDTADTSLDKLNAYYNHTPIARELLDIFYLVDLDDDIKRWLTDLIGSRISSKVLGYKAFESLEELELYCSKSNSSIYHLSVISGQQLHNTWFSNYNIVKTAHSVSDNLGIVHGLSNIIRGIPYNASKNCCYIPNDLLRKHNLTNRDFVSKSLDGEKLSPVIKSLAMRCQELMKKVHFESGFMPNYFRELFLPRVAIQSNLNKLTKCNFNITDAKLRKKDELLPLKLWMCSKLHRFPIL